MWRYLRWALLVLVLFVAGVAALPFLLPTGVYKDQIVAQVRAATGRPLTIDGDLSISFFPQFAVSANGVSFGNADGAQEADMATMERLVAGAEFWALLNGEVRVTHLTLVKPVINLEIDKDGRGNWVFDAPAAKKAETSEAGSASKSAGAGDLSFKDVTIIGGTLTYRDGRSGVSQRVENIDISVQMPALDEPMTGAGVLTWNNEPINISATVANPRAIADGGESKLDAKVNAAVVVASFDGSVDSGAGAIKGAVDIKTGSAQRLAAWFGVTLPKDRFGPMTLSGDMSSKAGHIKFSKAKVSLDDMHGTGNLALDTARAKPLVSGDFTLDKLDVNKYAARKGGGAGGGAPRARGWSTAPNDFSALNLVDAELAFALGALTWSDMKVGRSALDIKLSGGRLDGKLKQMQLYGGNGEGTITLDGSQALPAMGVDVTLSGVNAAPFLQDLADLTNVSGTGSFVVRLNASGGSELERMKALNGAVQVRFTGGAIRGVDLAAIARTITSALTGEALGPNARTEFSELSGAFLVRNGVAVNRNLRLTHPRVRLDGAGVVNIGARTVNYRVEPKPLSGGRRVPGLGVPFRIYGSWENPQYEPELGGVVESAIQSVLSAPGAGLDGLGSLVPGLGGEPNKKKTKKSKSNNPLDALDDLFGG